MNDILPKIKNQLDILNSTSFAEYEKRLEEVSAKAINELENQIANGAFVGNEDELVKAVDVLSKARIQVFETKRKLLETLMKSEIMNKAIEETVNIERKSVFDDYEEKIKNDKNSSIFQKLDTINNAIQSN